MVIDGGGYNSFLCREGGRGRSRERERFWANGETERQKNSGKKKGASIASFQQQDILRRGNLRRGTERKKRVIQNDNSVGLVMVIERQY